MFTELMPLIKNRPLTITVSVEGESRVRLNVVPKPIAKDKAANGKIGHTHSKEVAAIPDQAIQALTTPLSITGTPEEVDAGLAETLTKFAESHKSLQQSFDAAAAAIADAVKAIDDRERVKKEKEKAEKATKKPSSSPAKAEETKQPEADLPPLFTTPAATSAAASDSTPAAPEANNHDSDTNNQGGE
jgi:PRTRC genetic system protein E